MGDIEENPRRESSRDYYRTISLFSSFCVGLCMFGMIVGFVSNSAANKQLWGVLSVIFLISQSLLHFVDKFTRDQLSLLPVYLLNATRPILLLRLYYIGLFVDIITLMLTLIISYFFKFPQPIIATLWFVLLTTSWYNTNELRTYFIKSLEDVPSCSDADCIFHTKLYDNNNSPNNKNDDMANKKPENETLTKLKQTMKIGKSKTIVLSNKFEKIVYCLNRQIHYHYNSGQHVLTSLDAIKSWSCVYIMIYCIWSISFVIHSVSYTTANIHHNWGFILLLIMTVIQLIRIAFQVWALSRQQPQRGTAKKRKNKNKGNKSVSAPKKEKKHKRKENKPKMHPFAALILILLSPFSMRILIMICSVLSGLVFLYGVNDETHRSDIFTTWATGFQISRHQYLIICYGLSILLIIISLVFLVRFISQLSYLQSSGHASYYKANKKKDKKKNSYDMDVTAFLKLANRRLSDERNINLQIGRNERSHRANREYTLSTVDSSEPLTGTSSLDFTFELDEEPEEEQPAIRPEEEQPVVVEEYNKIATKHRRKIDMSLLAHIWFRMPYDKYFRITCSILSIMIILQTISISPNVLTETCRQIMLLITFCNVLILLRITWSSSFRICWQFSESLRNHLVFPQIFLMSYLLGILSTNIGVIYMILRIYYLHPNDYEKENFSDSTGDNNIMSLNCSYYECFNSIIMMATWWPISILINNENARFMDRYRKYNESVSDDNVGSNDKLFICPSPTLSSPTTTATQSTLTYNLIALQNKQYYASYLYSHHNKNMHKICGFVFKSHFPWINSIDGARPLIPILFLLLLVSIEIGLIQWDNCLSFSRLLLSCTVIFLVASRGILLIVSI